MCVYILIIFPLFTHNNHHLQIHYFLSFKGNTKNKNKKIIDLHKLQ